MLIVKLLWLVFMYVYVYAGASIGLKFGRMGFGTRIERRYWQQTNQAFCFWRARSTIGLEKK